MSRPILWGMPVSLYTGKARSYLLHNGIPFEDRLPGPAFVERVMPRVGRWIIPVLETPEGELIQDGAVILDHFEGQKQAATPETPRHRAVSALFELFGGEGLLRPAMHYRWNFDDTNLPFIRDEFTLPMQGTMPADKLEGYFLKSSGRMRKATVNFGVSPETMPLIEASYERFLSLLDAHLRTAPFLLGGRATRGDYGLIAPLYAHLGRDPYPASLMKRIAPAVYRWTERMNRPAEDPDAELFADDEIPETLRDLMRYVAEDYLPEYLAHVRFANGWLTERSDIAPGTNGLDDPARRAIGMATFDWRGAEITTAVMPYRFFLSQRVLDGADGSDEVKALFADTGLAPMLGERPSRRVERRDHLEVWGEAA